MRRAVFWIMLLGLVRDRGALVMSFVLPPAIFLIFAAVFANASSDSLNLKLAIADEARTPLTQKMIAALAASPRFQRVGGEALTAADVRRLVATGAADAGLIARRDGRALDRLVAEGPPPLTVIGDPTRQIATQLLMAEIRRVYYAALPEAALRNIVDYVVQIAGPLSPPQRVRSDAALRQAGEATAPRPAAGPAFENLFEQERASAAVANDPVAYYAGAVAVLFLLLAAVHGATTLLEEREAGILDRIASSPGGIAIFIDGKFGFMIATGAAQVALIFIVARIVYGVGLGNVFLWALVTVAAAAAAAGMALVLAAACNSRRQAASLGNFLVLVLSAIGGSMVPRFLMPGWLRDAGWLTPNTWALEAYDRVVRRGETLDTVALPLGILLAAGALGWFAARLLSKRFERL